MTCARRLYDAKPTFSTVRAVSSWHEDRHHPPKVNPSTHPFYSPQNSRNPSTSPPLRPFVALNAFLFKSSFDANMGSFAYMLQSTMPYSMTRPSIPRFTTVSAPNHTAQAPPLRPQLRACFSCRPPHALGLILRSQREQEHCVRRSRFNSV